MAMYRPGAVTNIIKGSDVGAATSVSFYILARSVVLDATVAQRDVTADGDTETQHANNGLVTGSLRIDGWADTTNAMLISNLQDEAKLTNINITIMPTDVDAEEIVVRCSVERVRVAYQKTDVGVAISLVCRVSDVNPDTA